MHGITHMIVSALVHGLVYGAIFKTFRALPLGIDLLIAGVGVGGIWLAAFAFRRRA